VLDDKRVAIEVGDVGALLRTRRHEFDDFLPRDLDRSSFDRLEDHALVILPTVVAVMFTDQATHDIALGVSLRPHHRRKDEDSFLSLAHNASQLLPGMKSRHMGSHRFLQRDEHHIVQAVAVKASYRSKIAFQVFALPGIERGGQRLNRVGRELFHVLGFHGSSP